MSLRSVVRLGFVFGFAACATLLTAGTLTFSPGWVIQESFDNVPAGYDWLNLSPGNTSIFVTAGDGIPYTAYGPGLQQSVAPAFACVGSFCNLPGNTPWDPTVGYAGGVGEALVDPTNGTIKAGEYGGLAIGGFADTVTLSQAAAVTISGELDGLIWAPYSTGRMQLAFEFYDPTKVQYRFGSDFPYLWLDGAFWITDTYSCAGPCVVVTDPSPVSYPFSESVNLPAGNTTLYAYLLVQSGAFEEDFTNTLQFSLSGPPGVTITSQQGIPIGVSSTPEPGALLLAAAGVVALLAVRRCQRN
jgi:hypothetical protein